MRESSNRDDGGSASLSLPTGPRKLGLWCTLIVLAYGGTLLGAFLGGTNTLSQHEVLRSEPAREMLHTGDWIIPRFGGEPAVQKPPVINWAIAGSMALFRTQAEWACRLPIVVSTLLMAWIIAGLTARWHGRRAGLCAGLVTLSAYYVQLQARLAEADMILALTVTAAMACFALACVEPTLPASDRATLRAPAWLLWLGFAAATAASLLTKFLPGPVFIFGGCGLWALLHLRWRAVGFLALALPAVAVLASPWFVAAYVKMPSILDRWLAENFGRFAGELQAGHGTKPDPWWFYLWVAPALLLPWTPWLLGGILAGLKRGMWRRAGWRFVACWFVLGLAFLSASSWKHMHYIIPALPGLSIVAGWYLAKDAWERIGPRLRPAIAAPLVLAGVAAGIGTAWWKFPDLAPPITVALAICGGLLVMTVAFHDRHRPRATLACLLAAFWVVPVMVQGFVMDDLDSYRPRVEFARRVNALAPADGPIFFVGKSPDQAAFYLRWPIRQVTKMDEFEALLAETPTGRPLHLVAPKARLPRLRTLGSVRVLDRVQSLRRRQREEERLVYVVFSATRTTDGVPPGSSLTPYRDRSLAHPRLERMPLFVGIGRPLVSSIDHGSE